MDILTRIRTILSLSPSTMLRLAPDSFLSKHMRIGTSPAIETQTSVNWQSSTAFLKMHAARKSRTRSQQSQDFISLTCEKCRGDEITRYPKPGISCSKLAWIWEESTQSEQRERGGCTDLSRPQPWRIPTKNASNPRCTNNLELGSGSWSTRIGRSW